MSKKVLTKQLTRFPVLYEKLKYLRDYSNFLSYKAKEKKFKNMSLTEIEEIDAKMYYDRQGYILDWKKLTTYSEKMQWAKIHDNDYRKSILADKYSVREWVGSKIGDEYLIPLLGAWDSLNQVPFETLPRQYVIKTNHGSGDAVIINDEKPLTKAKKIEINRKIGLSLKTNYAVRHCEMHYQAIQPKVIVEEYLDAGGQELSDYKFLCFDGMPYYCWIDLDRYSNHKRNIYDLDWNLQKWNQREYGNSQKIVEKPKNFDKMIEIVKVLSSGFSHVRVDLYNVSGKIYFGEMTFTNGSGFEKIRPTNMDKYLGDLWKLNLGETTNE